MRERSVDIPGARLTLLRPGLFLRKSLMVFALALLLLPLVRLKTELPAVLYVGALLALHIVVLGLYLYRTQFRELDPDRRSLMLRIAAIAFMTYLLSIVSGANAETPLRGMVVQVLGAAGLHTVLLAMLAVRVTFPEEPEPAPRLPTDAHAVRSDGGD